MFEWSGYCLVQLYEGYHDPLNEIILQNIPEEVLTKNYKNVVEYWNFKAEFKTMEQLGNFFKNSFGQNLVVSSRNATQVSANFCGTYGFIIATSSSLEYKQYKSQLNNRNLTPLLFISCQGNQGNLEGDYGDTLKHFCFILKERWIVKSGEAVCFYEVLVPDETCDIQVLLDGVEVRGKRGWILNKCVILNESLNPIIYMKGDPTNKSVHPFTFGFFPFMTINSMLQAHVRPLAGGIMENDALLSSTNTHLVMGFQIPEGFSVWIGNPRDIGILDGALLYCHVMFKLGTGWTHMKVVRYYVARKNGIFDYRVQHIATKNVQDIVFKAKKYGHGPDAKLSTWCLLRAVL